MNNLIHWVTYLILGLWLFGTKALFSQQEDLIYIQI